MPTGYQADSQQYEYIYLVSCSLMHQVFTNFNFSNNALEKFDLYYTAGKREKSFFLKLDIDITTTT